MGLLQLETHHALRIDLDSLSVEDLKMEVRTGRSSGTAHLADLLASLNLSADLKIAGIEVGIAGPGSIVVANLNPFAIAGGIVFGDADRARFGGPNRGIERRRQVNTAVIGAGPCGWGSAWTKA